MIGDFKRIYNAAIALNNTAVHLAHHGKYVEASETLQDAMRCTKLFCNGVSYVDTPITMQRSEYEQALQAARDRKSTIQTEDYAKKNALYHNAILVVSDQDDPQEVYLTLEQNHSLRCFVTIDPIEIFDENDVDRLQLESAVVVYNFGVIYRCMANQSVKLSRFGNNAALRAVSHFDTFCSSVQILELTHCVTTNLLSSLSFNGTRSLSLSSNVLLTSILVIMNLHQMSVESYSPLETSHYYLTELLDVLYMVSERELFLCSECDKIPVALAA